MPEVLALVHRKVHEGGNHECIVFRVHRVKGGREERKMERGREEKEERKGGKRSSCVNTCGVNISHRHPQVSTLVSLPFLKCLQNQENITTPNVKVSGWRSKSLF